MELKQHGKKGRGRECQRRSIRLRLFEFHISYYLDVGEISVQWQTWGAMHWGAERIISSIK